MAGRDFSDELFGAGAGRDFSSELFGEAPPEKQSAFRQIADVPLGVAKGAVQGVRMIADVFGAGTDTSKAIKSAETYLADLMSAQAKNDQQEIARIMKDAEDKGVLDQVKAGIKAFTVAPIDTLSTALGTAAPVIAGALGSQILGAGAVVGAGVSALTGAAMGAGTIKGSIYEETKNALKEAGASEQDAESKAQLAQEYGGKNLDQILLGTVIGGAAALGPLEKGGAAILARSILGKTGVEATESVATEAAKGVLRRKAEAGLLEAAPEAFQAGQEQVAQNIALQREGFDVPTFRGAIGAATLEGIADAGLGAAVGGGKPEVAAPEPEVPAEPTDADLRARYEELKLKASSAPEQEVTLPDGTTAVQPAEPQQFFTEAELTEFGQLKAKFEPEVAPEPVLQRVEEVTGVQRPEAPSAEESAETLAGMYRMDDAEGRAYAERMTQARLLRQQQEVDADAERVAELNRQQGIVSPEPPITPTPERTKPSLIETELPAVSQELLQAKQAEVDKRRLAAGLPTGESSITPGVEPTLTIEEPKPVPKIVDNRPLAERAAKNRLLVMRNMLQNQGGDPESLTIVSHPTAPSKFAIQSLDVPTKLAPDLPRTAITRPETPAIIDPVNAYVEIQRRTNTPAARRFVQDFKAGKIERADVERAIEQEQKAAQPQPLTYTATGAPGIIAAEVSKPRGEREVPKLGEQPPSIEVPPEEPPGEEPPPPTSTQPQTLEEFQERMPIVFDKTEVREANAEGNFTKLTKALQLSKNPAIRRIGQLGGGIASKITLRKPGKLDPGVAGVYMYADDSIKMIPSHAGNEHTNAHETLHALISKAQRYPTDRQKPVVEKIEKLYAHVKKEFKRKGITAYGLTNPREFTAEAMTNPQFQYELMQIPYSGRKSAWTEFTRLVADLLGIKNTNALTEVMNLVDRLAMQKQPRQVVKDKGLVDQVMVEEEPTTEPVAPPPQTTQVPQSDLSGTEVGGAPKQAAPAKTVAAKATEKAQEILQKQKMPKEGLEHIPEEVRQKVPSVFYPQNKTIIDRISGMEDKFWQRMAQGIADQYRSIKEYSPVAYMQARLSKSIDGGLEGLMFHGHVFNDGGALNIKPKTQGLIEILKPIGKELDSYLMWVALNRESQLPDKKRSKIANMDYLVKNKDTFAAGTLNGKPRIEVYQEIARKMNLLNKSVLDIALSTGLIDQTGYNNFSKSIYYVPFYRVMEGGDINDVQTASGLTSQEFSKELKGGEAPFGDLMENILRNWNHILSASMKNQAANSTLKAAIEMGAAKINFKPGYELKDGKVYSTESDKPVSEVLNDDGTVKYKAGELRGDLTKGGAGLAKIVENGQTTYYKVTDPLLMDAISSIGYLGPKNKFLDVAKDFKNMLQFGVTLSPAFKVNNLIRDSVAAMAVSELEKDPVRNVLTGLSFSDPNDPRYISALAGGAIFTFGTAYEGDTSKLVKRLVAKGVDRDTILDTDESIKKGMRKIWDKYQEWGNKSESANRMALYTQLRDKGMSHLEASFKARDLLDFSMQGSWGAIRLVTQVVPFMNARIQGLYKLGRDGIIPTTRVLYNSATGKEIDATDKQKAQAFLTITTAVGLASAALYLAFKDDEEFKKRDQWDRDNFWWFKLPNMDAAVRIPKPFEIGAFGTLIERTLEQILEEGAEGKQFGDSMSRILWDTFAMNPIPQMVKPLVDLYANKDSFTGAPIESVGMERLSKQERMTNNTSVLAQLIGPVSSWVLPEKFELSPLQADYLVKGYFGWMGATAAVISNYAATPFREGEYPDARWLDRMSVGLVKELPTAQSAYVTSFYDNSKIISQAMADMRHYAEMGDSEKVQRILEEQGDKIALGKFYDKTAKTMANIRKQINIVTADPNISGAEKKIEIDRMKLIISDLAKQAEEVRKSMKK